MPHRAAARGLRFAWHNLAVVVLILTALGFTLVYAQIQDQRRASCRQTYEGVRQIFTPFFTAKAVRDSRLLHPKTESGRNIRKFNRVVDERKAGCGKQIERGGEP